jgi:glycerol uptake facilitator-like aquaporin
MTSSLARRLSAEALGTAVLVATVVGSGVMAERLTSDRALALLGNTLPTGAILVVLITILGPVSGAHFNPVVSMLIAFRRQLAVRDVAPYVLAQIVGGLLGTWSAHMMFDLTVFEVSQIVRTGSGQWLSEFVATGGLIITVSGALRYKADAVSMLVGFYITAAYWFTASTSFANPAVTVARSLTDSFSGIRPVDVPFFVVAQILGACTAALLAGWLFAAPCGKSSIPETERA